MLTAHMLRVRVTVPGVSVRCCLRSAATCLYKVARKKVRKFTVPPCN